jgi:hypothetical protein
VLQVSPWLPLHLLVFFCCNGQQNSINDPFKL